jgi:opacity protein-like surface antigen
VPLPGAGGGGMPGIYYANEYIFGNPIPDVTQTITLKDRFSITPVVQAGYIFKAALAGKDVLGYVEMGPHFSFTKLSVETKFPNIADMYSLASGEQVALPQGSSHKVNKTSVGVGIALGTGVKVAVSDNLVVSLGYRFTKIPGSSVKATLNGASLKKVKIPSQSHNILVGLAYSF